MPLLRLSSWLSYHNGSAYISALIGGFAGTQSFEQLDFSTRLMRTLSPPAILARGMLVMLQYGAGPRQSTHQAGRAGTGQAHLF